MGLVSKFLHGNRVGETKGGVGPDSQDCRHTVLAPHWDRVEDMGHDDRAVAFICDRCGKHFPPEEARELRAGGATPTA